MKSARVLVVEDNLADVRLLQEALYDVNAQHVKLIPAQTLQSAIDLLDKEVFDAALVDLSLPDSDGLQSVARVQSRAPKLPILVLTGLDDSELAAQAVREGAQDYLVKGQVDGPLLLRAIRYAVERMRSLQALTASERQFRSLIENALDIITVIDSQFHVKYASPSTERVLGYGLGELERRDFRELLHPDDIAPAMKAFQSPSSAVVSLEFRVRHKEGYWCFLEAMARNMVDDPVIAGIVINSRDITERKHDEERLHELNERLRAVIDTSPLSIFVLDREGLVQGWNKAAEKTFGWTEDEVVGRPLPIIPPGSIAEASERMEHARQGNTLTQVEAKRQRKDGSLIDVAIWTALLHDQNGEFRGFVVVMADTTEQKRLEEQFRQAQKMEAIGRLAGGVAHDFNNLLTVITGYSQLALTRINAGAKPLTELEEVLQSADRAAALTKQLLAFSRRQVVAPAVIDANALVKGIDSMLRRVLGEDIRFATELTADLSPVRVDRSQLELVLLNLAVNARDAMPHGGALTISTSNIFLSPDSPSAQVLNLSGDCVMIAVSDNGVGIDPQVKERVFEPFFTTKEVGKGTGLGLSSSYGIVRQHGGDIRVISEPGRGATFQIYLPVASENVEETPAPESKPVRQSGTETILLVEDDPAVARVIEQTLLSSGYEVLPTNDPARAVAIARDHKGPIHLLVSDIVMHTMNGVDLSRHIRTLRPDIKVLFVSGYNDSRIGGQRFLDSQMPLLQKPFAPETLAAKVRGVLNEDRDATM